MTHVPARSSSVLLSANMMPVCSLSHSCIQFTLMEPDHSHISCQAYLCVHSVPMRKLVLLLLPADSYAHTANRRDPCDWANTTFIEDAFTLLCHVAQQKPSIEGFSLKTPLQ